MKILIVSDTHRRHAGFDEALRQAGEIDRLIHLGDTEGGEHYVEAMADCPCYIVAGNNDFFSELPRELEVNLGKYKVFLTHGHYYYVSLGTERIIEEAKSRGADIVMFGHTHRPMIEKEGNITILNPGSLSFPRQEGRRGSYIIMEIDENDKASFTINYL